ncbi:MAG: hypothetical protein ORN98_00550 [Alphaproteobacteria bacterium]|nr:hypothetical protein [Alphaproteobacteria bacterium]
MGESSSATNSNNQSMSGHTQMSTSDTAPWLAQQSYLTYGYQQAKNAYQQALNANATLPTGVQPSAATLAAQRGITHLATSNQPVVTGAQSVLTNTLNGNYMAAGNPYLQQMIERVSQAVLPNVQSGFEAAGRFNSGAQAAASASAIANAASNLGFQQYDSERSLQSQAINQATPITQLGYYNLEQLANVGASQDAASYAALAGARQQALNPLEYATQYMNLVNKPMGSSTTTQGSGSNFSNSYGANTTIQDPSLLSDIGNILKIAASVAAMA